MNRIDCASCEGHACKGEDLSQAPSFCPRLTAADALEAADEVRRSDPDVARLNEVARGVEHTGYRTWPRVQELVEFGKRMGIKRVGIAFCVGLRQETRSLVEILESHGFEVHSVACTVNGGCNPVGQALTLAAAETELNVVMGLCLGDDMLFNRFSKAPTTTLVVKDRVTCHNPAGPLFNRYWRRTLLGK